MDATLLEAVFNNLLVLLPLRVVHSYERGVRFRFGQDIAELQPGVHWFWPFFESIEILNIAPETRNLPTQTVTTKDGHTVTFSTNMVYQIVDARACFTKIQDFDAAMEAFAMMHLARAISRLTFLQLKRNRTRVELQFARAMSRRVKPWGAKIIACGLTDLCDARSFRLFGDAGVVLR